MSEGLRRRWCGRSELADLLEAMPGGVDIVVREFALITHRRVRLDSLDILERMIEEPRTPLGPLPRLALPVDSSPHVGMWTVFHFAAA